MVYQTKVIDNNGLMYEVPYYEIGLLSEKIVSSFISKSIENKKIYDEFKENYSSLNPSFDFMISKMEYKILNPFIFEQTIMYYKDGLIVDETLDEDKVIRTYPLCNNNNFCIKNLSIDNLLTSVISPEGKTINVNRNIELTHDKIYEMILIHEMIYNKKLYEDYIFCRTNKEYSDIFYNISSYFINRLGFLRTVVYDDKSGFILLNKQIKNEYIDKFLFSVKEFYPDIEISYYNISDDLIEQTNQIIEEVGDLGEYRRF